MTAIRCVRLLQSMVCQNLVCNQVHLRSIFSRVPQSHVMLKKRRVGHSKHVEMKFKALSDIGLPPAIVLFSTKSKFRHASSAPVKKFSVAKKQIYVYSGKNFDYSEEHFMNLFSKFGAIDRIEVTTVNESHGYAIITFSNESSVKNALSADRISLSDDRILHIRPRKKTKTNLKASCTYVVYGLPDDITISQLDYYFSNFCNVKRINLIINSPRAKFQEGITTRRNYAIVLFEKETDSILCTHHEINNSLLTVVKVSDDFKFRIGDENKKVYIEGLPKTATEKDLYSHFNVFGQVRHVFINISKKTGIPSGTGIVHYNNAICAQSAAENVIHEFSGSPIRVRLLGFASESN